jgi:hypothetical protein
MPLISNALMSDIAASVRYKITPYLEDQGYITNDQLKGLIKATTGHQIVSERTLNIIQTLMTEH